MPVPAPEPVCVARVVTFGKDVPGKLQTRSAAYMSSLKSSGLCAADARAAVTLHSSRPTPVRPLFATETAASVLEYTHELRLTRPAIVRLERFGIPVKLEVNHM